MKPSPSLLYETGAWCVAKCRCRLAPVCALIGLATDFDSLRTLKQGFPNAAETFGTAPRVGTLICSKIISGFDTWTTIT